MSRVLIGVGLLRNCRPALASVPGVNPSVSVRISDAWRVRHGCFMVHGSLAALVPAKESQAKHKPFHGDE